MQKVYIGFNFNISNHDWSISWIYNGELGAIELERLEKSKHFPQRVRILDYDLENLFNGYILKIIKSLNISEKFILNLVNYSFKLKDIFLSNLEEVNYYFSENHHFMHACSTYFASNFNNSAIICIDGAGYDNSLNQISMQTLWYGEGNNITFINSTPLSNTYPKLGIGFTYELFAELVGLEEGSFMGLSSYGDYNFFCNVDIFILSNGQVFLNEIFFEGIEIPIGIDFSDFKNIKNNFINHNIIVNESDFKTKIIENIKKIFNINEKDFDYDDITKSIFSDLAAKVQYDTCNAIVYLANNAYNKFNVTNLCLAGGVVLNVVANSEIYKKTKFKNIFVQPASNDGGLSLGSLYYLYNYLEKNNRIPMITAGLGFYYSDLYIKKILDGFKNIVYKNLENNFDLISEEINKNMIIGFFQGKSEFGSRALGFRSILANTKSVEIRNRINKIKNRELWRPLAAVCLEKDLLRYFGNTIKSDFMTFVGKITNSQKLNNIAIVHIDNTTRYQTINNTNNSFLYNLLTSYKNISGDSILINTSFNNRGQPIVESPEDAINTFLNMDLDLLVIGNFLVKKIGMKNKRVCIPISGACNSNCIFCMDNWELSSFIEIDDLSKKLKSAKKYCNEVTFSSLEPTLHPKLFEIVNIAKEMNFKKIEIVTNGRKLKDYNYVETLIKSGINEFNLSIHSYTSIIHNKIVRSKGAFEEAINGLINLVKLKKEYNILINISVTVCKQNYKDIYKIVYFLEKFNLDNIILNILQPRNEAVRNKNETFVKYSYMIKEFEKLEILQDKFKNIYINGLVPCLEEKLKNFIGYFNGAQINFKDKKGDYIVEFDNFKEKRIECKKCTYDNICEGVWKSYISNYGWDEFVNI